MNPEKRLLSDKLERLQKEKISLLSNFNEAQKLLDENFLEQRRVELSLRSLRRKK